MSRSDNNLVAVLRDTANAIREKKSSSNEISPRDFADEISTIETGIEPTGTKSITENANQINIREFEYVDVNVAGYPEPTGSIDITENGSDIDIKNYATANVNVPIPAGYIQPAGTVEIKNEVYGLDIANYKYANAYIPYLDVYTYENSEYGYTNNTGGRKIMFIDDHDETNHGSLIDVHLNDYGAFSGNFYGSLPGMYIVDNGGLQLDIDTDWVEDDTSDSDYSHIFRYKIALVVPSIIYHNGQEYNVYFDNITVNFALTNQSSYSAEDVVAYLQSTYPQAQVEFVDLLGNVIVRIALEDLVSGGGGS